MKKTILLTILLLSGIAFYSCKKSDNSSSSSTTTNGYTIGSTFFNTEKSGIIFIDSEYTIVLYSKSVTFDTSAQHWMGTGNVVSFGELTSGNVVNGVPIGTYNYHLNTGKGYFSDGETLPDFNFTDEVGNPLDCIRGYITITQNGNLFHLKYVLNNADSSTVTGIYDGSLPNITSWFRMK